MLKLVSDTSLWTKRYTSSKYGLEPKASLKYFQQYLELDFPRTIRELCKNINAKRAQNNSKTQIRESTLYSYSCKYDWSKREEAHDEYYSNLHEKAKQIDTEKWESKQLRKAMNRVNKHNASFEKLHDDENIPINKKIYAESENEESYGFALDNVYKIRFGGVPPRKNINSTNLNADIVAEADVTQQTVADVKAQKLKELRERMDSMTYD